MPSIKEALNVDLSNYDDIKPTMPSHSAPNVEQLEPIFNSMLRCPLPPIAAYPDSLRQFYMGGKVPQLRLIPPTSSSGSASSGTTIQNITVVGSTTSGTSTSTSLSIVAKNASITTPVLDVQQQYTGTISLAKSFQLLSVSSTAASRIRLYGTSLAQSNDAGRALDTPFAAGTWQNVINEVILDTIPYQWTWQNRIGSNGDFPQNKLIYITITNIDVGSAAITVNISYVPLET